ncbi:hypothetical protein F4801DRAFT_584680 [Xylaria longipes]|nr:hypothetical protein F4801DRAFT_584680 [Xylaria longipes]RYC54380.1 hypothetical protein CHU98_g11831 [Xylaria longipes]
MSIRPMSSPLLPRPGIPEWLAVNRTMILIIGNLLEDCKWWLSWLERINPPFYESVNNSPVVGEVDVALSYVDMLKRLLRQVEEAPDDVHMRKETERAIARMVFIGMECLLFQYIGTLRIIAGMYTYLYIDLPH